jgi:hypothetical protein
MSLDDAAAIVVDAQGGIVAAGTTANAATENDMTVIRLSPEGEDAACLKNAPDDPDCRPCTAGCDDGDPCTADGCDTVAFCVWTPVAGDESATCGFQRFFPPADCTGARVPRPIRKKFTKAGKLVGRGLAAGSPARFERLLGRASRLLERVVVLVDKAERRKRRPLPGPCANALRALVQDTRARVEARLAAPAA